MDPLPPLRKRNVLFALRLQRCARFVRGRNVKTEFFKDATDLTNLFRVGCREPSLSGIETILKAHSHASPKKRTQRCERHLISASGEYREQIVITEKTIGGSLEMH